MAFDILPNEKCPDLPWTFRLPFKGERKKETKPTAHSNGIRKLTKVEFTYLDEKAKDFIDMFSGQSKIGFRKASGVA